MKKFTFFKASMASALIILSSCSKDENLTKTNIVSFEDITLNETGFNNGSDGSGGFTSGNAVFKTSYDATYNFWSGFAVSNHSDSITPGIVNQYSSITGSGANSSKEFALLYSFLSDTIEFIVPAKIINISISNSTYTYYSMKYGNEFSKKFGGASGLDEDYFHLNITAVDTAGNNIPYNTPIYLADFTFSNNSLDYISKTWENYDLSSVGYVKYLIFSFSSSDTSIYGINTPTYVCIDNITSEWEE